MLRILFLALTSTCQNINITILGTNDVHGRLTPIDVVKDDG